MTGVNEALQRSWLEQKYQTEKTEEHLFFDVFWHD